MDNHSITSIDLAIQDENHITDNVQNRLALIQKELNDLEMNGAAISHRPIACSYDKVASIKEGIIDYAVDEEFVARDEFIVKDGELIAENEEFVVEDEEFIVEDEVIVEREIIDKDDIEYEPNVIKKIYTSNLKLDFSPVKLKPEVFLSNATLESNKTRQSVSSSSFSKPCSNIDTQQDIISLERNICSKSSSPYLLQVLTQEHDPLEIDLETSCLLYDDEGKEKIVPILRLENLIKNTEYASFAEYFRYRFADNIGPEYKEPFESQTEKQTLVCSLCQFACEDPKDINNHMNVFHGPKGVNVTKKDVTVAHKENGLQNYQCDECKKVFKSFTSLNRHLKRHNVKKLYSCPLCSFKYVDKCALKAHVKRHNGIKPFSCSSCEYKTDNSCNLERHLRTHNGEKPLSCPQCSYKSADASSMSTHIKRHNGVKPQSCPHCDYKCLESHGMIRHIMVHTGEKKFHCFFCKFRSIRFDKLSRHLLQYDGSLMKCGFCSFKSSQFQVFNNHLKLKHKNDWVLPPVGESETVVQKTVLKKITVPKNVKNRPKWKLKE